MSFVLTIIMNKHVHVCYVILIYLVFSPLLGNIIFRVINRNVVENKYFKVINQRISLSIVDPFQINTRNIIL